VDLSKRDWKSVPPCFPSHLDGGAHIVSQDDKLRWSAVVKRAEAYDIDFSHNGAQNSEKAKGEQEGGFGLC